MKLYLRPSGKEIEPATGIGRVVIAQLKYLPQFGFQIIDDPNDADVVACHTTDFGLERHPEVLHAHGLYWTHDKGGQYSGFNDAANARIISAVRRAKIVTVPSEWVAMPFKRDMRITPEVIGHGIDLEGWRVGENDGFILWNKNRPNDVCDPMPAWELAQRGLPVQTTFAPPGKQVPSNMAVLGRLPFDTMKKIIQNADIYLATAQETFGIGTVEAMACGVPVLGYAWAGTLDIVEHKTTGYLVQPGDIEGLLDGYDYIQRHRDEMSFACKEAAKEYTWDKVIGKYADVYERAAKPDATGVTVVIPCYNYAPFVGEAIESCLKQVRPPDKIIVIDDGSTDNSRAVIEKYRGKIEIIYQQNQGVSAARNLGIERATTPFITCLDADDRLAPLFIATCLSEIEKDRGMGIAYTGIGLIHGKGPAMGYTAWPPDFTWERQAAPHVPPSNAIPSACMFRKSMWERAGGYRQVYKPGEDCEFWTRGLSVGFTAKKVSNQPLFEYRVHQNSASRNNPYRSIADWMPWMYDKDYPLGVPTETAPKIRSYLEPLVSVIIPCGPGHYRYLPGALESLLGQTFREWEAIVIHDALDEDAEFDAAVKHYPFIRKIDTCGNLGAGWARNDGIEAARAPLVLFLDADDWLYPGALMAMVDAWQKGNGEFIYTDWVTDKGDRHIAPEYDEHLYGKSLFHAVTVLMTKEQAELAGKFDTKLDALEDHDFFIRCAIAGFHGKHLPGYFLTYRTESSSRRTNADNNKVFQQIYKRYADYFNGGKNMPGCCGGAEAAKRLLAAKRALNGGPPMQEVEAIPSAGSVRIEYYGPRQGAVTYSGKSGKQYRFGNSTLNRYADVEAQDAELFLGMEFFRRVNRGGAVIPPMEAQAEVVRNDEPVAPDPEPVKAIAEEALVAVAAAPKHRATKK